MASYVHITYNAVLSPGGYYTSAPHGPYEYAWKVEALQNWTFDHWEWSYTPPASGDSLSWDGDITPYVTVDNANAKITVSWIPVESVKNGGTIIMTPVFTYAGDGQRPTNFVTVRTATTGGGQGTTTGDGMYPWGSSYTVTATADPGGNGVRKSKFIKWTNNVDSSSPTTASVTRQATQDVTWTAEFELVYEVKAAKQIVGGGTGTVDAIYYCTVSGFGEYAEGESVTLSITPESGATIIKVKDGGGTVYTPSNGSVSFTMPAADKEFYVLCAWSYADVSVKIVTDQDDMDSSGGTFSPDPSGHRAAGYTVQMTATPSCGYVPGWSADSDLIWAFGAFISAQSSNPATFTLTGGLQGAEAASFPEVDTSSLFRSSEFYDFEVYFHSEPDTGKILYSVYDGGTIIYGANGMPMAQFAN